MPGSGEWRGQGGSSMAREERGGIGAAGGICGWPGITNGALLGVLRLISRCVQCVCVNVVVCVRVCAFPYVGITKLGAYVSPYPR